jgi:ABC-type glutathione transport system ATPase component
MEILQMALFEPRLAILDETDSGLDIDALKLVAEGVNALREPNRAMVVITHYQRLLSYIVPDRVHVLAGGRIVKSGGADLALELETSGYEGVVEDGIPSPILSRRISRATAPIFRARGLPGLTRAGASPWRRLPRPVFLRGAWKLGNTPISPMRSSPSSNR